MAGNVQELQNVLERAAVLATGEEIGAAAIFGELSGATGSEESAGSYRRDRLPRSED